MSDLLESVKGLTDYIQSAPPVLLIILALNGLGLVLKHTPLPNKFIPLAIVATGALLTIFLAPIPQGRNPNLLLAVMGFIFGLIAWLGHAVVLKRLEKFLPDAVRPADVDTKKNSKTEK